MATATSEALDEAHRTAQATRATLISTVVAQWWLARVKADDPKTVERWLAAVIPAIMRGRGTSAALAATYGAAVRKLELPEVNDGFRFQPFGSVEEAKLRTSLMVVGPQHYADRLKKIESRDLSPEAKRLAERKAAQQTVSDLTGASLRHVLDGGRLTIAENTKDDPKAVKLDLTPTAPPGGAEPKRQSTITYTRVLGPTPCYFCAMLASRSAPSMVRGGRFHADSYTYSDALFVGDGTAKVHDNCKCSMKPIYRTDDPALQDAEQYAEIWHRTGSIIDFRRAFEGRERD